MRSIFAVLSCIVLLCAAIPALAQYRVSGSVIDSTSGHTLELCSVKLVKLNDPAFKASRLTTPSGTFVFTDVAAGAYRLDVIQMGYIRYNSTPLTIPDDTATALVIKLKQDFKTLQEVTVTRKQKLVDIQPDKTVLNVADNVVASNSNAGELLQLVPGLTATPGKQIQINGKTGVTIMIDGKTVPLSPSQMVEYLENLPSNNISKIELLNNPSARQDAAGSAGIINIITKKNNTAGWNGSVTSAYNQGVFPNYVESAFISATTGKFSFSGSYSYSHLQRHVHYTTDRSDNSSDPLFIYRTTNFYPVFDNHAARLGIEYNIDRKNYLGLDLSMTSFNRKRPSEDTSIFASRPGLSDSSYNASSFHRKRLNNYALSGTYSHLLDSTGSKIDLNYTYSEFDNQDNRYTDNFYYDAQGMLLRPPAYILNRSPFQIYNNIGKVDYTLPAIRSFRIEAGIKASWTDQNSYLRYDSLDNGIYKNIPEENNDFRYKENVSAAYVNVSRQQKGLRLSAGLRVEKTVASSNWVSENMLVHYNYLDWFPSLQLNKKLSPGHELNISITRRIDRPSYQDLDPSPIYLNDYYYVQGNAFLKPQYNNSLSIAYTLKEKYIVTLGLSRIDHPISSIQQIDSITHVNVETVVNLDREDLYSLSLSVPVTVTNWWDIENDISGYYDQYSVNDYLNASYNRSQMVLSFNTVHSFNLSHGFKGQVTFRYNSPRYLGLNQLRSLTNLTLGVQKSLLNKKANIKLSVYDLLNTMISVYKYNYANVNSREVNNNDVRQLRLSFTYNLGGKAIKRRNNANIESGEDRVKIR